jgi:dTDP-4-amino-4,6-dideoxygalactose transaminase
VVRVPKRDQVRERMTARGVGTEIYYPVPLHLQQCFAMLGYHEGDMPHSEAAARETLALPIYPELTEDQIRYVASTLLDVLDPEA